MTIDKILKSIRESDGSPRLSDEEREAIEFFGNPQASIEDVSDEKFKSMIAELGGYEAAIRLRALAVSLEKPADNDINVTEADLADDPTGSLTLPVELTNALHAIAAEALSRKLMRSQTPSSRTTAAFTEHLLDTKVIIDALDSAGMDRKSFMLYVMDKIVAAMAQQMGEKLVVARNTLKSPASTERVLKGLQTTDSVLQSLDAVQRRSYCLHAFMEYDFDACCQMLEIENVQFHKHYEDTDRLVAAAIAGQ